MMETIHYIIFGTLIYLRGVFMGDYNSSQYLGAHVDLQCESETPVDCTWKVNGIAVYIGENYHYMFSNGSVTTDCSINIPTFQEDDVGNWTCWSLATDQNDGQLLNSYQLTIKTSEMEEVNNHSSKFTVAVRNGWSVVLDCKFDTILEECHWFRNNEPVVITNRYKFVNFNQTGSDCSINITAIKDIDFGSWQCTTSANNIFGYRSSYLAWLTSLELSDQRAIGVHLPTAPRNYVTEHPRYVYANLGDIATIPCNFKNPVHCVWLRNGRPIHVGHLYNYAANKTIGSNTTNCTLTISHLIMNDFGRWTCIGAASDSGYAIKSNSASIQNQGQDVIPNLGFLPWRVNSEVYYALGAQVIMPCQFKAGHCVWTRNGQSVKISNRYSFFCGNDSNFLNSLCCPLRISSINDFDAGNWSCSNMLTRVSPGARSIHINTTLYVTPKLTLMMNDRELSKEDNLWVDDLENTNNTLLCKVTMKNKPPSLTWRVGDKIFPGVYRYVRVDENVFLGKLSWIPNSSINFDTFVSYQNLYTKVSYKMLNCEFEFSSKRKETFTIQVNKTISSPPSPPVNRMLMQTSYMTSTIPLLIDNPVTLNCTFNKLVNCSWTLNRTTLTNSSIYEYLDTSTGQDTTNCSIVLNFTRTMVDSRWQCSGTVASTRESRNSSPSTLTVMKTPLPPVIKWRNRDVKKIFLPEIERNWRNIDYSYSYGGNIECKTQYVYPSPTLHFEANGKVISERINNEITLYSSNLKTLLAFKNVTELRCGMNHPTLNSSIYTVVEFEKYKVPIHPVIEINGTIWKTNVTLPMNDRRTQILCVCQNGYPSANLSWSLDGKKLAHFVDYRKVADFQYTTTLEWQAPAWKLSNKSMQLKCVAEHPGWDNPELALATITFVYNTPIDHLQLLNEDKVMHLKESFVFHCISSQPVNCSLMLNNAIVKEISPVPTVPSNDLLQGHIVEHCYVKLPPFVMQYVGEWQCTDGVVKEGLIKSNKINLTPFETPLKANIEVEKRDGYYMDEESGKMILKNAQVKLQLKCVVNKSNPVSTLRWVLNGNNITSIAKNMTVQKINYLHDTILRWDSALNFTQTENSAVLQCVVFFPTSEIIHETTDMHISIEKSPSKPVIFFNDKATTTKVDVPQPKDFNGFKCICKNGNPAAKLHWQVNGQGISGQYENHLVADNTYTAELHWDPRNNYFLSEGPIKLACVAIHPSKRAPIIHGIQATIKVKKDVDSRISGTEISPLKNATAAAFHYSAFHYFGIALLSTFIIGVAILIAIIYIRIMKRRSSGESSNINISSLFSCFGRIHSSTNSPLIKYEHCKGGSESQAIIIGSSSEN